MIADTYVQTVDTTPGGAGQRLELLSIALRRIDRHAPDPPAPHVFETGGRLALLGCPDLMPWAWYLPDRVVRVPADRPCVRVEFEAGLPLVCTADQRLSVLALGPLALTPTAASRLRRGDFVQRLVGPQPYPSDHADSHEGDAFRLGYRFGAEQLAADADPAEVLSGGPVFTRGAAAGLLGLCRPVFGKAAVTTPSLDLAVLARAVLARAGIDSRLTRADPEHWKLSLDRADMAATSWHDAREMQLLSSTCKVEHNDYVPLPETLGHSRARHYLACRRPRHKALETLERDLPGTAQMRSWRDLVLDRTFRWDAVRSVAPVRPDGPLYEAVFAPGVRPRICVGGGYAILRVES